MPEGWLGPSKPGVRPNELRSTLISLGFFATAFIVSVIDATVPPDAPPAIARTRPRIRGEGLPVRFSTSFCVIITPRSKGMESNPLEKQMRAPLACAASENWSIFSRIQVGSPHRSV